MKRWIFLALLLLFVRATGFAESERSVQFELSIKKTRSDSLQQAADELENRAKELERQLKRFEVNEPGGKEQFEERIEAVQEEIEALREKVEEARKELRDTQRDVEKRVEAMEKESPAEKRPFGSFILSFEYSRLDVQPIKSLVKNDNSFAASRDKFDFSDNRMMMFGIMGYYNMDNNVRVGNGIFAGYKLFQSEHYRGVNLDVSDNSTPVDSIALLRVIPAYVGFICEKAFVFDPVNFFAGIMLGGNVSVIVKEEQEARQASSFIRESSDDDDDDRSSTFSVAVAPAIAWDVHGGIAFRLSQRLHIGVDGVVRFAYAYEGYGAGFGDFLSVCPGVRLRLTFGSAG